MEAISLVALIIAAIAFSAGGILVGKLFVKGSHNPQKGQPYECGIPTDTSPWHQFNVGYYLFALLFLVFDVELVFLYPWAVTFDALGLFGLAEMAIFIGTIFVAFAYVWRRGGLEWD